MGSLIVFEGIDGTGKSTACRLAAEALRRKGLAVEVTAEPTHEGIGAFIRSGAAGRISQRAESLLFTADRWEHTEAMRKSVSEGKVVLCDRYYASTAAYQSAKLEGDSADMDWLMSLCEPFVRVPDVVILLDADPAATLERVGVRGEAESKFENLPFLTQVRAAYLDLAERYGYEVVDASRPADDVLSDVLQIIHEVL
ncbi:MAG: dTMP kinase [Thermoplasmata archaeon]|nr:dTMP kinase [Thermoplasmata archaeon]